MTLFSMVDPEGKKFGRGPREPTGAVDLICRYKLLPLHDFFCKRTLPLPISETHYLHKVAGNREIRKGEGMELEQLFQNAPYSRETISRIQPFDLNTLGKAFHLQETSPVDLPPADKGIPTVSGKSEESKEKERKHKKHKDREKKKDKEHKHRHKEPSNDKNRDDRKDKSEYRHKDQRFDKNRDNRKDKSGQPDSAVTHSKKHGTDDKNRKHGRDEDSIDALKHKKLKIKCSNQ